MTTTTNIKNVKIKKTHNKMLNLMAKDTGTMYSCIESIVKK